MAKKKVIYISGRITGEPDYKAKFAAAKEKLQKDYTVMLPTFIDAELDYEAYMHIDLAMIDVCDAIYLMTGWELSPGARREASYAKDKRLEIIIEDNWKQEEFTYD